MNYNIEKLSIRLRGVSSQSVQECLPRVWPRLRSMIAERGLWDSGLTTNVESINVGKITRGEHDNLESRIAENIFNSLNGGKEG